MDLSLFRATYFLLAFLLVSSCAQVRTPSGGDRDEIPPKVIASYPQSMTTSFHGSQIIIEFDEYVQLDNPREQILISPPLAKAPDVKLKSSKTLVIDLGEELLPENTTYTINLGESIKDNNEGNVLLENVFLFSTGDFIDSLSISGQAVSGKYLEPLADVTMLAFPAGTDSIVLGQRPQYVTRCDAGGHFTFSHMASGEYELIALLDLDKDLKVDKNESIGFLLEPTIASMASDSNLVLRIHALAPDGHALKRGEWAKDGRSVLITSRGSVDSLDFIWPNLKSPVHVESWNRIDSVRYWFDSPVMTGDMAIITSSEGIPDTLRAGRVTENTGAWSAGKPSITYAGDTLRMNLDRPIQLVDTGKITLIQDSLGIPFQLIGNDSMHLELKADWQYGARYNLLMNDSALVDIYGSASDSILWPISIPQEASLGKLNLKVELVPGNYQVYLISKDKKVVKMKHATETFNWNLPPMPAGEFWLWVVEDSDGNGEWTPASYTRKQLPERVYYRSESIKLRANWEMELTVTPTFSQ